MKAIIFESSDDLIEQLMELHKDIETEPSWAECDDDDSEYLKGIYNQSMDEIKKFHTEYPYLVKTKKFSCYII